MRRSRGGRREQGGSSGCDIAGHEGHCARAHWAHWLHGHMLCMHAQNVVARTKQGQAHAAWQAMQHASAAASSPHLRPRWRCVMLAVRLRCVHC